MHLLQLCSSEEEIWRQLPREMEDGRLELEERASRPKRKHFLKSHLTKLFSLELVESGDKPKLIGSYELN